MEELSSEVLSWFVLCLTREALKKKLRDSHAWRDYLPSKGRGNEGSEAGKAKQKMNSSGVFIVTTLNICGRDKVPVLFIIPSGNYVKAYDAISPIC